MKKAILFDLDGTLWDATESTCAIWNLVFDRHKEVTFRMTQERITNLMGKTIPEIEEDLFPQMAEEQRKAIVGEVCREEIGYLAENGAVLYDGLEETLEKLSREYGLHIVSNCEDGYVQAFLHAHKLGGYFTDMEMAGRTGLDKGKNIRLLMERNRITSAVFVGDTASDERAARDAGIPFIWARYGFGEAVSPDGILASITDLPTVLSKLSGRI